jgi:hypothetical protein
MATVDKIGIRSSLPKGLFVVFLDSMLLSINGTLGKLLFVIFYNNENIIFERACVTVI